MCEKNALCEGREECEVKLLASPYCVISKSILMKIIRRIIKIKTNQLTIMKRIRFLPIFLALYLLFTMVACTNNQNDEDSAKAGTEVQTAAKQESPDDPFVNDKESWN